MYQYEVNGTVYRYCNGCNRWVSEQGHIPADPEALKEIRRRKAEEARNYCVD